MGDFVNKQQYHNYLQSPAWQVMRLKVLRRADFRCEECNKARPLDVHHLTYDRVGNERTSDLKALCRSCHTTAHGKPVLLFNICQTCGEFLMIVKQTFKDGWVRLTCSDDHINEYRKRK